MREAHAVIRGPGRPSPVDVLARMASSVHGPATLDEKLAWTTDALRFLTEASMAAYVGLRAEDERPTAVAGVASYEIDSYVRPALARLAGFAGPRIGANELRRDRRWRLFLERAGHSARADAFAVAVPAGEGGAYGVLLVVHSDEHHFDEQDAASALALAAHLGVALDNEGLLARLAEIQQEQRGVVHALQEAVRPPTPTVDSAELGIHHLPADRSAPTGGDLHDWLVLPNGDLFIAVVDVMGKGVTATKDAVAVTHALRLLALDGCPLDELVARADALLTAHSPDLVATAVAALYRPSDGHVSLANGGQPPPLLMTGDGKIELISATGVAIGWPGAGSSEVVELVLDRNDTLVLYTDGLIESTKDVLAGLDNLIAAAGQVAQYPAAHVARALVERSLSGAMRRDDALALVLRRRTPPPPDAAAPLAPFEYRFSPSRATIPLARHLLSDWLEHIAVEDAERADLVLVASELCANAVRHASGAPSALSLRAWAEGDAIVVEVEDDGEGFELDSLYDDEVPDLTAERGRGLYVVEALTDEVSVRRDGERTVVRVVRRAVLPER